MPPIVLPLQLAEEKFPATKKRASSGGEGDGDRELKKAKIDDAASERLSPAKKDKKRRRKKKKAPVTQDDSQLSPTESRQTFTHVAVALPANSPSSSVAAMVIVPLATKDSKRPEFVEGPSTASSDTLATLTSPCTNVSPPTSASSTVAATASVDQRQDVLELTQTLSEKTEVSFILHRMISVFTRISPVSSCAPKPAHSFVTVSHLPSMPGPSPQAVLVIPLRPCGVLQLSRQLVYNQFRRTTPRRDTHLPEENMPSLPGYRS